MQTPDHTPATSTSTTTSSITSRTRVSTMNVSAHVSRTTTVTTSKPSRTRRRSRSGRRSIATVVAATVIAAAMALINTPQTAAQTNPTQTTQPTTSTPPTPTATSACGMCVTQPTGTAVTITGSSKVTVTNGGVAVASTGTPAVSIVGSSKIISGGPVTIGGTLTKTGSSTVTGGAVVQNAPAPVVTDPYVNRVPVTPMATPNVSTTDFATNNGAAIPARTDLSYRNVTVNGSGTLTFPTGGYRYRDITLNGSVKVTMQPGYYRSLSINGSGKVTLNPGQYVFTGPVNLNGSAEVTGTSIDLQLACATTDGNQIATCTTGQTGGTLNLRGSSKLTLNGRTPQQPSITTATGNTSPITLEGSSKLTLPTSGIDAGSSTLSLVGSSGLSSSGPLVVSSVVLTGSSQAVVSMPSAPDVTPFVACREVQSGADYVWFGYRNTASAQFSVPASSSNSVAPGPVDQGQPTVFPVGQIGRSFSVLLGPTGSASWTLRVGTGPSITITGSRLTPICPPTVPLPLPVSCPDSEQDCPDQDLCAIGQPGIIYGSVGEDVITGTAGDDTICAFDGNDTVDGLGGNDRIFGGAGNDTIRTGLGDDWASGQEGVDQISGGDGSDALDGGPGDDRVLGEAGDDYLYGSDGVDVAVGGLGSDECNEFEQKSECETEPTTLEFTPSPGATFPDNPALPSLNGVTEVSLDPNLQIDVSSDEPVQSRDYVAYPVQSVLGTPGFLPELAFNVEPRTGTALREATLKFHIPDYYGDLASVDPQIVWFDEKHGDWVPVADSHTVDSQTRTVSARVTHFSTYAIVNKTQYLGYLRSALALVASSCKSSGDRFIFDVSGSMEEGPVSLATIFDIAVSTDSWDSIVTISDSRATVPITSARSELTSGSFGELDPVELIAELDSRGQGDVTVFATDADVLNQIAVQAAITRAYDRGVLIHVGMFGAGSVPTTPDVFTQIGSRADLDRFAERANDFDRDNWTNCEERKTLFAPLSDVPGPLKDIPGVTALAKTKPASADTDSDLLTDSEEIAPVSISELAPGSFVSYVALVKGLNRVGRLRSDPTVTDTDGDGLNDQVESKGTFTTTVPAKTLPAIGGSLVIDRKSSPLLPDTDGDGIDDSAERLLLVDPANPARSAIPGWTKPVLWLPGFASDWERKRSFEFARKIQTYEPVLDPDVIPIESSAIKVAALYATGDVTIGRFDGFGRCLSPDELCTAVKAYASTKQGRKLCEHLGRNDPTTFNCSKAGATAGIVAQNVRSQGLYSITYSIQANIPVVTNSLWYDSFLRQRTWAAIKPQADALASKLKQKGDAAGAANVAAALSALLLAPTALTSPGGRVVSGQPSNFLPTPETETPTPKPVPEPRTQPAPLLEPAEIDPAYRRSGALLDLDPRSVAEAGQMSSLIYGIALGTEAKRTKKAVEDESQYIFLPLTRTYVEQLVSAITKAVPLTTTQRKTLTQRVQEACESQQARIDMSTSGTHPCADLPVYAPGDTAFGLPLTEATSHRIRAESDLTWARKLYLPILHYRPGEFSANHYKRPEWVPNVGGTKTFAGNGVTYSCPVGPSTKTPLQCDEYPNHASYEGGPDANLETYTKPAASLEGINGQENGREGSLYGSFSNTRAGGMRSRYDSWKDPTVKSQHFLRPGEGRAVAFLVFPHVGFGSFWCLPIGTSRNCQAK